VSVVKTNSIYEIAIVFVIAAAFVGVFSVMVCQMYYFRVLVIIYAFKKFKDTYSTGDLSSDISITLDRYPSALNSVIVDYGNGQIDVTSHSTLAGNVVVIDKESVYP